MYIEIDQPREPSASDSWLYAGAICENRRGIKKFKAKRRALRKPQSKDPSPQISWPELSSSKRLQKTAVLTCLAELSTQKLFIFYRA